MGAPYIYNISSLRVNGKQMNVKLLVTSRIRRTRAEKGKVCEFRRVCLHKKIISQECGSSDFRYKNLKFKELKINIEVEEIHPTTGIKNAGMEIKWFKDLYSNIQKLL
jgi:hypothetical protein